MSLNYTARDYSLYSGRHAWKGARSLNRCLERLLAQGVSNYETHAKMREKAMELRSYGAFDTASMERIWEITELEIDKRPPPTLIADRDWETG